MQKLFIISLCLAAIASCGRNANGESFDASDDLTDVLMLAHMRRESIIRPGYYQVERLTIGRDSMPSDLFYRLFDNRPRSNIISANDAIYDVQIFFSVLSGMYGPYIYFGGDEIFFPIRDDIIEVLNTRNFWYVEDFAKLLRTNISRIVTDLHFDISRISFRGDYVFLTTDRQFIKTEYGFLCKVNNLYVNDVKLICTPDFYINIDTLFRLSIDERGSNFFHTPVVIMCYSDISHQPIQLNVIFEDGIKDVIYLEILYEALPSFDWYTSLNVIRGFPVVTMCGGMGSLYFQHANALGEEQEYVKNSIARQFLAFAEQVRDEPVIILDLRNNLGGNTSLPTQWLYTLLDEHVPPSYHVLSVLNYYVAIERFGQTGTGDIFDHREYYVPFDDNHIIHVVPEDKIVSNNQLLIVLTNRYVFSAAEVMVNLMFNVENTLIVGQNTGGAMLTTGGAWRMMLPYSGISFLFSTSILVQPAGHFREGHGIEPDIWVTSDALQAVLGMLESHLISK